LALSIALLAHGIVELALAALAVFLIGPVMALPAGLCRTLGGTILLTAITMTADQREGLTAVAIE